MTQEKASEPKAVTYKATLKTVLSCGEMSIPVKLYKATESHDIELHQVHAECGTRLRQQDLYCPFCTVARRTEQGDNTLPVVAVAKEDAVKGYEYESGLIVTLTEEEIESTQPEKVVGIQIERILPEYDIDPIFYTGEVSFVGPDKGGETGLSLLARSLRMSRAMAIGRLVERGRSKVLAIRTMWLGSGERHLAVVAQVMRYAGDVRDPMAVVGSLKPTPDEAVADFSEMLAKVPHETFALSKYEDPVRAKLLELIETKKKALVEARETSEVS